MKRFLWLTVFLTAVLFYHETAYGQHIVVKSDNAAANGTGNGIFYSLPKTVFEINVTIETVTKIKGPLSDYSRQYLGTDDYIKKNSKTSRIIDVKVKPITFADPQQTYWLQFPAENPKDKESVSETFILSPFGTILAYNENFPAVHHGKNEKIIENNRVIILTDNNENFSKNASYNRRKKIDTVVRKITIDTVTINRFLFKTSWVNVSEEGKADDAAKQITRIREARYNLLTGFQEVNYGESIKYMDSQLQKLEHQYLELFLGKEMKSVTNHTFIFDPSTNHTNEALMSINTEENITKTLTVKISGIKKLTGNDNTTPPQKIDNIFYRIPATATIEINLGSKNLYKNILTIPQLGEITSVPLAKNRLQFDFNTGMLIKFIKPEQQH